MRIPTQALLIAFFLFFCLPIFSSGGLSIQLSAPPADLESILIKLAAYCEKLEAAAIDFICREDVTENIDPSLDVVGPFRDNWWQGKSRWSHPAYPVIHTIKGHYIYDYQCIRVNRQIREHRTLIEENGKKMNVADAIIKTSNFVYGNALLSPVGLFAERFQPGFDFKIVGQDMIEGRPVVVIDATPKAGTAEVKSFFGKAWVDAVRTDILKIEWSEERIGRYELFQERGNRYKRRPRIIMRSEFSSEKNGIRFPSRLIIEEAYINDKDKAFIRSKTTVIYKDFKFFTVNVDVNVIPKKGG